MKKAVTAYANGDWTTMASCFSDTAISIHNNDTAGIKMSDRIELFKNKEKISKVQWMLEHLTSKW